MKMKKFAYVVLLALVVSLCVVISSGCSSKEEKGADFSGVSSVAELATLKCYYHNVAKGETEGSWFLNMGYKKVWIEYDGVVEVGVDASQITVSDPDVQGKVKVHIPEAQILNVYLDKDSISAPIIDTGFLTNVTTEEKTIAFAEAQSNMEKTAAENKSMLNQARERAKQIIEAYVKNVGSEIGKSYSVEWV